MSEKPPQVYDVATDSVVDVTQKWCDEAQDALRRFVRLRAIMARICQLNTVFDQDKIDKIAAILDGADVERKDAA